MEDEERRLQMAIIAGAANAIRFKEKNPMAGESEVVQHVTDNVADILKKIDDPL